MLNKFKIENCKIYTQGRRALGSIHTQDWEPVTITLQALSLVEMAELVQVRFTQCLRDQRIMWMQDGCKAFMDST
jgi:hypothetical protein